MSGRIEKLLPAHCLAMQHIGFGPGIAKTWEKLRAWATQRGFTDPQTLCFGIPLDDPSKTPIDQCRYDAAIEVPANTNADAGLHAVDLPGGEYLIVPFRGNGSEIGPAFGRAMHEELPKSGRKFDSTRYPLERYRADCFNGEPPGSFHCDLCIPID